MIFLKDEPQILREAVSKCKLEVNNLPEPTMFEGNVGTSIIRSDEGLMHDSRVNGYNTCC